MPPTAPAAGPEGPDRPELRIFIATRKTFADFTEARLPTGTRTLSKCTVVVDDARQAHLVFRAARW